MPRPIRVEFPGGVYHVMARGNERKAVYRDDRDRQRFLETPVETAPAPATVVDQLSAGQGCVYVHRGAGFFINWSQQP